MRCTVYSSYGTSKFLLPPGRSQVAAKTASTVPRVHNPKCVPGAGVGTVVQAPRHQTLCMHAQRRQLHVSFRIQTLQCMRLQLLYASGKMESTRDHDS